MRVPKNTIAFLNELKQNNSRDWFNANKDKYLEAKDEFEFFVSVIIEGLITIDPDLERQMPKDTTFRIYRDIRFSKNKLPYKTNMGSYICRGGKKSDFGGYYIHLEPQNSFIGGGVHMPSPEVLKKIRADILENGDELTEIIQQKDFMDTFNGLSGEKLKNPPRGYDKNLPYIDLLKYKSFTVFKKITDQDLEAEELSGAILRDFQIMLPLVRFLNYSIEHY